MKLTKKNVLLVALLIIASSSPFGSKAITGIKNISATPSQLIVEPEAKISGAVRLVEFPAYYGFGYAIPEPDMSQGWLMGGYEWPTGGEMTFKDGIMKITYFKPTGNDFDPYIFHRTSIPADKVKHLSIKLRFHKAPSPTLIGIYAFSGGKKGYRSISVTPTDDWQIIRFNMSAIPNNFWHGMRTFRIDLPEPTNNAAPDEYMQTIVEIDWIALTTNPGFEGSSKGKNDFVWDFTPSKIGWKDSPSTVYQGSITGPITIDRFDGSHDRMYSKFQFTDANEKPIGNMRYVTDLSKIEARDFEIPWPKSIKGLTCIFDVNDAIELGIKHAPLGVRLDSIFDRWNGNPTVTWEIDGQSIPINMDAVQELDSRCKKLTDAGVNVIVYIANRFRNPDFYSTNPFIHPSTKLDNRNFNGRSRYGAFNVVEPEGLRYYRAAIEFLANRYTCPDRKYGLISGFSIGNEVSNHWVWYNMGRANGAKMTREYTVALRIADLAARRFHKDLRVYVSLDHWWTVESLKKHIHTRKKYHPLKRIPADEFLKSINVLGCREGNFPWNVGFHPYPEILGEPRFWRDKMVTMKFDTSMITFKNLEVLPAFLRQKKFLYQGQPRHIILAEQGCHTLDGPDGEKIQAASFAYAFHKVRHMPEIEAFMYHRHVDCSGEGKLRLGLWTRKEDTHLEAIPDKKKLIYNVFKEADTPNWKKAFEPYLSVIGISSWDEALPTP